MGIFYVRSNNQYACYLNQQLLFTVPQVSILLYPAIEGSHEVWTMGSHGPYRQLTEFLEKNRAGMEKGLIVTLSNEFPIEELNKMLTVPHYIPASIRSLLTFHSELSIN